jgi:hypothetical protein
MLHRASILSLSLFLLGGCPKESNPPDPEPTPGPDGLVCCESFGYGSMMAKCCESYEWTAPDACAVSADHVGGGKQVVDASLCASLTR